MFKFLVFLTILSIGVFGLPATKDKASKYPKKYVKEIHGADKKIDEQHPFESSYLDLGQANETETLSPPPGWSYFQDTSYDLIPSDPQFTQDDYSVSLDEPVSIFVPPPQDSYSNHNGEAVYGMVPPQDKGSSDKYSGYADDVYGDYTDYMTAPEPSSYSEVQSDYNTDSQFSMYSDGLSPPALAEDMNLVPDSSYLTFEESPSSSYAEMLPDTQSNLYSDGLSPPALAEEANNRLFEQSSSSYSAFDRKSNEFKMEPPTI